LTGRLALETVACPACDLLQQIPPLPPGGKARCPRCGETLGSRPADPLDRPLALTIAAAIVFIVANTQPLMGLSAVGRQASTTILGGAYEMWVQGLDLTAMVVASALLPMEGRPARISKSLSCKPPSFLSTSIKPDVTPANAPSRRCAASANTARRLRLPNVPRLEPCATDERLNR